MKFGRVLAEASDNEWKFHYVSYSELKAFLKSRSTGKDGQSDRSMWSEDDEAEFIQLLDKNLERVSAWCRAKQDEFNRKLDYLQKEAEKVTEAMIQAQGAPFQNLRNQLDELAEEVALLSKYAAVNYTAFMKILKKHDKVTPFSLKPSFSVRIDRKPFYRMDFSPLILGVSRLYSRWNLQPTSPVFSNLGDVIFNESSERSSTYWVRKEDATDVKLMITKHLPVLVFKRQDDDTSSAFLSTLYFDDDNLNIYHSRMNQNEKSHTLSINWYGEDSKPDLVWIERRIRENSYHGNVLQSEKVILKGKMVMDFITGRIDPASLREKFGDLTGKSGAELDDAVNNARSVQNEILEKGLKPLVRVVCKRTTFQGANPGSGPRIIMNSEAVILRERLPGQDLGTKEWCRQDAKAYPYSNIPAAEIDHLSNDVVDVRISEADKENQNNITWLRRLTSSRWLTEVPRFSFFAHGCAVFNEKQINLLPFWFHKEDVERPAVDEIDGGGLNGAHKGSARGSARGGNDLAKAMEPNNEDEANEKTPLLSAAPRKGQRVGGASGGASSPPQINVTIPSEPPKKRIQVPVRVEPKVFFANERTFLNWLHTAIYISTIGVALLNFGDRTAMIAGIILVPLAMVFIFYSLVIYFWRAKMINERSAGPYDDRIGPIMLVSGLVLAMLINYIIRLVDHA
eukprot:Clim_evm2s166 gene=Clim_evmTU2s166